MPLRHLQPSSPSPDLIPLWHPMAPTNHPSQGVEVPDHFQSTCVPTSFNAWAATSTWATSPGETHNVRGLTSLFPAYGPWEETCGHLSGSDVRCGICAAEPHGGGFGSEALTLHIKCHSRGYYWDPLPLVPKPTLLGPRRHERPAEVQTSSSSSNNLCYLKQLPRIERQYGNDKVSQTSSSPRLHQLADSEAAYKIVDQVLLNVTPQILTILQRELERLRAAEASGQGECVESASVDTGRMDDAL